MTLHQFHLDQFIRTRNDKGQNDKRQRQRKKKKKAMQKMGSSKMERNYIVTAENCEMNARK